MRREPDHLYVATDGKLFKIGITVDPVQRASALGRAVQIVKFWRRPYARELESFVKSRFSHCRTKRSAEWFTVAEQEFIFEVQRAVRILDDERAIRLGLEPSKRPEPGEPCFVPPVDLPWVKKLATN